MLIIKAACLCPAIPPRHTGAAGPIGSPSHHSTPAGPARLKFALLPFLLPALEQSGLARAFNRDGFIPMNDAAGALSKHMRTPVAREHLAAVARSDLKGRFDVLAKGFHILYALRARRGDSHKGKELPVAYGPAPVSYSTLTVPGIFACAFK